MESLSNPHWESLTNETRQAFHQVARLPFIKSFYLAGGTGLALHLGHRFSVDLDLFSPEETVVGPDQRDAMRNLLDDPSLSITYDNDGTFVATWAGCWNQLFPPATLSFSAISCVVGWHSAGDYSGDCAMKLAAIVDRGTR